MNFIQILGIVAPVFVVIGSGVFLRAMGWMKPEADSSLLKISVNLLFPALIANSILGNSLLTQANSIWLPPVLGFGVILISFCVVYAVLLPVRLPPDTLRAGVVSAGIQNYGYLVIPLVEALYDKETLGVLFMHNLGVEMAMWSVVVSILSSGRGGSFWKHLLNVPVLAIISSVALNLLHANDWLPFAFRKSLQLLGQAAIPIALLLTGGTLFDLFRQRSKERPAYGALSLALLARLALLPMVILCIAKWIPMPSHLQKIMVLQAAMPAGMMPLVLCRHYNSDARFSLQIILGSTLVGIITIPIWIQFGLRWVHS